MRKSHLGSKILDMFRLTLIKSVFVKLALDLIRLIELNIRFN